MDNSLLALLDALAVAEVADYLSAQPAPSNDPSPERSERPASDNGLQAA